jgi:transposase-like protein
MEIICGKCGSYDVLKQGFRDNKSGRKQKYQCYDCKSWFVEDDGFKKMRHKPEDIVRAVHMHNEGMSLFKTQDHLWQHDGVKVTPWTVSKWTKKYADFLKSSTSRGKAKAQRKAASR